MYITENEEENRIENDIIIDIHSSDLSDLVEKEYPYHDGNRITDHHSECLSNE